MLINLVVITLRLWSGKKLCNKKSKWHQLARSITATCVDTVFSFTILENSPKVRKTSPSTTASQTCPIVNSSTLRIAALGGIQGWRKIKQSWRGTEWRKRERWGRKTRMNPYKSEYSFPRLHRLDQFSSDGGLWQEVNMLDGVCRWSLVACWRG